MAEVIINTYNQAGTLVGTRTETIPDAVPNRAEALTRMSEQIDQMQTFVANWSSLTAAQKDELLRRTCLVVLRVCRVLLRRHEST